MVLLSCYSPLSLQTTKLPLCSSILISRASRQTVACLTRPTSCQTVAVHQRASAPSWLAKTCNNTPTIRPTTTLPCFPVPIPRQYQVRTSPDPRPSQGRSRVAMTLLLLATPSRPASESCLMLSQ
jgi:hypothetical protein